MENLEKRSISAKIANKLYKYSKKLEIKNGNLFIHGQNFPFSDTKI